jgi:hypothetical protein
MWYFSQLLLDRTNGEPKRLSCNFNRMNYRNENGSELQVSANTYPV